MAKSKHSVALFEVIQASRSSRSGGSSLATPKWWFKRRPAAEAPVEKAAAAAVATLPPPASAPIVFEPQYTDTAAPVAVTASRPAGVDMNVDPDRQRISFHFTYTSAIIVAFSVVVAVSLAYIVGQHIKQGPTAALAGPSVEEVRSGSVQAAVTAVGAVDQRSTSTLPKKPPTNVDRSETVIVGTPTPIAKPPVQPENLAPTVSPSGERQRGLNYIIVQSWPEQEKQMALDACTFLNKNGVACTIEQSVPGFGGFSVVTLTGFPKTLSSPEYVAMEKTIRKLGEDFAKTSKFKRFTPVAKKW